VPLSAVATASAADVERDRDQVAFLQELYVSTYFENFAGVRVAEDHALGSRKAAAVDVLVTAADVRGHDLEDDAVRTRLAPRIDKLGKVEILNLQLPRPHVGHCTVSGHTMTPLKNEPFFVSAKNERYK
jgi:hypothetical protein